MKLASFDIFDTTLIRKCGEPQNIFILLSKKLFPDCEDLQTDFFMWRLNAERNAKEMLHKEELTLNDIYVDFDKQNFTGCTLRKALEGERELEAQQLVSNMEVKEEILEKRKDGYIVCFISDMYLDSAFLLDILVREGCAEREDKVFVSNEYGKTKRAGDLYETVRETFGNIDDWIHFGDNKESDFKKSKEKGIKSILINTDYTKNEKSVMESYRSFPFGHELSTLVGFQRCARLHLSKNDADYENAADYIASTYIPYLDYVFRKAHESGMERLYFLSRDSYILYQLAPCFQKIYPEIECKYFFVSRKALLLPLLKELTVDSINNLLGSLGSAKGKTVYEVLKLFQLESVVKSSEFGFDTLSSQKEVEIFVSILKKHESEIKGLQQRAAYAQDLYFRQEGMFEDKRIGMVDVGWFGSTRLMINQLRNEKGLPPVTFFYLACRRDVLNREYGPYYSFHPYEFNYISRTILVESYYSLSPYSSTTGYRINSDMSVPLFEEEKHEKDINSTVEKNVETLKEILSCFIGSGSYPFASAFSIWGIVFMNSFFSHPDSIRYKTFESIRSFDGKTTIIKNISIFDVMRFFRNKKMGYRCLQINSLYYSYSRFWGLILLRLYQLREYVWG